MGKNKNIENSNWELQAKFLSGEATKKERIIFESWLNKSEENRREFYRNKRLLHNAGIFYKSKQFNRAPAWEKVNSQIEGTRPLKIRGRFLNPVMKYAAIFILAALIGSVSYYLAVHNNLSGQTQFVSSEEQATYEVSLPDGTIVTLNSNSKLTFPKQFSEKKREVEIIGEAFFEVKPNPGKPFIIKAGKAHIRVLGTSFNVSAYPGLETVEVIVQTGKVEISTIPNKKEGMLVLDPGEKGTLFNKSNLLQKSLNKNPNFYSWKTHNLTFNKSKLSDVIPCLENTYHVKISLAENDLNNLSLTAHFSGQSIEYILEVIRLTFNLDLSSENEQYILKRRN